MSIVKTLDDPPSTDSSPAFNRRSGHRHNLYMQESAKVELTTHHGLIHGSMVDVSTSGLGVGITDSRSWSKVEIGDEIEVQIETRPGRRSWPLRGKIQHKRVVEREKQQYLHVGIAVEGTTSTTLGRKRLSGFASYVCPDLMRPIAYCSDPLFFGEMIHFQIKEIRPSGLLARTSLRNKSLFPGEKLDLQVMIPNAGEFDAAVQLVDVRIDSKDRAYQTVELAFVESNGELLAALGEFVLGFSPEASVQRLRDEGFFLDTIFRAIRLGFASGEEDWKTILDLRLKAYHSVGKCLEKNSSESMRDRFDAFSRQIVARAGGRVVGAARVVFVGTDRSRSEHESLGISIPEKIIQDGVVEFSRFCNEPEFRGADVFIALMRQATYIAVRSNARYIVANCNSDLWNVYKRIGFKKIGAPFEAYGRNDCYLIYGDIRSTVFGGKRSGLVLWNQVVFPVQQHVQAQTGRGGWHPWILLQKLATPIIDALRLRKRLQKFEKRKTDI